MFTLPRTDKFENMKILRSRVFFFKTPVAGVKQVGKVLSQGAIFLVHVARLWLPLQA